MAWVYRTYACGFGHEWNQLVERGSPPPDDCPVCGQITSLGGNNGPRDEILEVGNVPVARSENIGAPLIRSERARAVSRFEGHAFKRVNCDDERVLLTNLHDNNREGDVPAVLETPSTNETMRFMRDMHEQAATVGGRETEMGRQMLAMGGGWGAASGQQLSALASMPQDHLGRSAVDLQSKKRAKGAA